MKTDERKFLNKKIRAYIHSHIVLYYSPSFLMVPEKTRVAGISERKKRKQTKLIELHIPGCAKTTDCVCRGYVFRE